jgi:hypothetical protein
MRKTAAVQWSPQFSKSDLLGGMGFVGREPFGEDLLRGPQSSQAVMQIPPAAHDPRSERIRQAIICRSSPRRPACCCVDDICRRQRLNLLQWNAVHEMILP